MSSEAKQDFKIKKVVGSRVLKNGTVKKYEYERKVQAKTQETRGAKPMPHKKQLRESLKTLNDLEAARALDFVSGIIRSRANTTEPEENHEVE